MRLQVKKTKQVECHGHEDASHELRAEESGAKVVVQTQANNRSKHRQALARLQIGSGEDTHITACANLKTCNTGTARRVDATKI
jgi:hypothetical protein